MTRFLYLTLTWTILTTSTHAQIFWPMLGQASPCAVQQGAKTECQFTATYVENGAYAVLVSGSGVTGEIVSAKAPVVPTAPAAAAPKAARTASKITVRFTVAPDAPMGIRDVRLLTPNGPSSVGQIVVVHDPIIREVNPNGTMQQAQPITWPATLTGAIESKEDVDFFKFKVEAGAALTFHVYCQRLQNKLTTVTTYAAPMIALRNSAGTVLATNDFFFGGDPLLHHRFTTAGEYYLEIRDVRYDGNAAWEYAIEVHDRPFVTAISPACLPPGVPTKVRLIGFNLPADPFVTLTLPADFPLGNNWQALPPSDGKALNSVLVRAISLPIVMETATHDKPSQAQMLALPAAVAGVLERPGEVDCYAFQAKKSEMFTFQIAARPLNSELDSVLRILDQSGKLLVENDDASEKTTYPDKRNEILSPDSRIENWVAPADGRYVLEVSDGQGRGGARFTYSLMVRPSQPHFRLELSLDRTVVAPGGAAGVIFVRAVRKEGFTGDIQLAVEGLPKGVTAVCGSIPGPCQDGCILLRAASDALPRSFGAVRVLGTAKLPGTGESSSSQAVVAQPFGELLVQGGSRFLIPVDNHIVAVIEPLDIKAVRFSPSEITLKPGEQKKVEVSIERQPGFEEPVSLSVKSWLLTSVYGNCLPEGVEIDKDASQIRLVGKQPTGTLVFKAAANAKPVKRHLVPILAEVSINFSLRMYYSGDPFRLSVE